MTIAEEINANFDKFTPSERKLANTLLANYPMAGMETITDLAATAGVSTPTVMRTAKKLGFNGFSDMQNTLREELKFTLSDPTWKREHWANNVPADHILNLFTEAVSSNLRLSLKQLNQNVFDDIVQLLADENKTIHLVGGKITRVFAEYLYTHLQVIRKNVYMLPTAPALWSHHLLNVSAGDILITFDVRRYDTDLQELAKLAFSRGVINILFTDQWLSPIERYSRHYIKSQIEAPSAWDSGVVILFFVESIIAAIEQTTRHVSSSRIKELEKIYDFSDRSKRK